MTTLDTAVSQIWPSYQHITPFIDIGKISATKYVALCCILKPEEDHFTNLLFIRNIRIRK
ncbi:hypothetical protein BpHYR1_030694 [Brachionus plicatilis]|uniref:Uncharacterized protein n=1 Tax=Brachionus plicatilis TaxID=10195 RepID=A0A3M7SBC3_BRAPC|nr:hypothetical protein BpHYR1_030694 [Brachionus plicatilis]